jgi:hypothetical protein
MKPFTEAEVAAALDVLRARYKTALSIEVFSGSSNYELASLSRAELDLQTWLNALQHTPVKSEHPEIAQVRVLDIWSAFLPALICNEDLGEYVEDINRRILLGQKVLPWIRCVLAIFWTAVNAIGFLMQNTLGRPKKSI